MFALCLAGWLFETAATAADADAQSTVLHFPTGDYVSGRLLDSPDKDHIVWQADGFAQPLRFPVTDIHSIRFPAPAAPPELTAPYCFELMGGDCLFGRLVSLDDRQAILEVPDLGKLHVDRSRLHRFYRVSAADLIFAGPDGLDGWKPSGPERAWRDEAGQLSTDQPGASIRREIRPAERTRYEFELAWNGEASFELAVGLGNTAAAKPAFRIETWGRELVVSRESEKLADLAVIQQLTPGGGQLRLLILFDQPQGRLLAYSSAGEKLADFTVPDEKTAAPPAPRIAKPGTILRAPAQKAELPGGLQLLNRRGDIKLQRLTVGRWSGIAPRETAAGLATIHRIDGTIESAEVKSFDEADRLLIAVKDGEERRISDRDLQDVVLSPPAEDAPSAVRVLLANGARLSGDLTCVNQESVSLSVPGITESLVLPLKDLQSVLNLKAPASSEELSAKDQVRLDMPGVYLRGRVADTTSPDSCLIFHPCGSTVASPLAASASGKLTLRADSQPPKTPSPPMQASLPARRIVNGMMTVFGGQQQQSAVRPAPPGDCLLHLRTGDTVPCRVQSIDERGLTFISTVTDAEFVPHERIKALELRLDVLPVKIERTKFERLLTLPRMQRDNPPEHLIRSLEGDYLRGRLLAMNERELELELRLEATTIDRSQVSRILWLHPDEAAKAVVAEPDVSSAPDKVPAGIQVQTVPRQGHRLTFFAQELVGNTLLGESAVLGPCRVNLDQIDQILIGSEIAAAGPSLAFHQWKLRPAAEPLPDPEPGAGPSGGEGMESVLVGKEAPVVDLDLLDGRRFRLSDRSDKVVILDFWASWCGPCLQVMPQIEQVANEFAAQGVELVSINLQESPERIKATLKRLKLKMVVALDTDGRVAERYGATSIPQMVIVDRDGKVARLFVGASVRFDEQLRQALNSVLNPLATESAD